MGSGNDRLHPQDERVKSAVRAFMLKPKPTYDLEFRLRHRDGSYRWIHSQGRLIMAGGKPIRLLGVHVDITASKEREAALQKSEQRFRRPRRDDADPRGGRSADSGDSAMSVRAHPRSSGIPSRIGSGTAFG